MHPITPSPARIWPYSEINNQANSKIENKRKGSRERMKGKKKQEITSGKSGE
jgi:hypothetical protein